VRGMVIWMYLLLRCNKVQGVIAKVSSQAKAAANRPQYYKSSRISASLPSFLPTIDHSFLNSFPCMSLPRINSRTPLQVNDFSMSFSPAFLHPRKYKYRTTFLALLSLIFLSTYFFFTFCSTLAPSISQQHNDFPADHLALALESLRNSPLADAGTGPHGITVKGKSRYRTQVRLDSAQELAAISSFLASLPQNVLPLTVDPSTPLDPQLVLDFDTRGPRASDEVRAMVEDVWSRNPVFVYSKVHTFPFKLPAK